jgi:hypothetical protein
MASVVAEERYVQKFTSRTGGKDASPAWSEQRTLVSDFILISGGRGEPPWMTFRDVLEVDGVAVRDRDDRLQRLFASGGNAIDRASALSLESSRYNLGPEGFVRTINTPIVALDFLLPDARPRFAFHRRQPRDDSHGTAWLIEYAEKDRPTVIRTPKGESMSSRGTFWIDPSDGRVVESTLELWDRRVRVTVFYEIDPLLQVAVPVRMKEAYVLGRDERDEIEGDATYSNFRRFETSARIIPR